MIGVSERLYTFSLGKMIQFMMYHGLMYVISPFFMIPLIFVYEKLNYKIIYNLQFLRANPICITNIMITCTGAYSMYKNYIWYLDEESEFDVTFCLQFLITILLRSVVVGSKYSLFSEERLTFFRELYLSQEMVSFDLTFTRVNDTDVQNHLMAIEDIMEELKIDPEFFEFYIYKD